MEPLATALVTIISLFWVGCGIINYGFLFAHFQRKFPTIAPETYKQDRRRCIFASVLGPIGLLATWLCGFNDYGFKWR